MTTPPKAKKNPRNQPVKFDESLSMDSIFQPPLPFAAPARKGLSQNQVQTIFWLIYSLAVLVAGLGLGRLIIASIAAPEARVAAAPVAKENISLSGPTAMRGTKASPVSTGTLPKVISSSIITQAFKESPQMVMTTTVLQPASPVVDFQPGYVQFNDYQGTVGTAPVGK